MPLLRLLLAWIAVFGSAFAAVSDPAVPTYRIQNFPGADGSVQQCLVFQCRPGDILRVERSDDLQTGTADPTFGSEGVYSLGQEIVIPTREFTPPPPGSPPYTVTPCTFASLRIQPVTGGGSVVSWAALSDGSPISVPITGDTVSAWASVPMVARRFGDFYFFIMRWDGAVAPPAVAPLLSTEDAAMLASFEANLGTLNSEVAASATVAQNTPPPAPPASGSRRFWKGVAAETDTDHDGTNDALEFQVAADLNNPSHAIADPFSADSNADGIPDGMQINSDQDGLADELDPVKDDETVDWARTNIPRFAVIPAAGASPATGAKEAIQINDKGTILYRDGTWTGGVWTPLVSVGSNLIECQAKAINDLGEIVGTGRMDLGDGTTRDSIVAYWSSPSAAPVAVALAGKYACPSYDFTVGITSRGATFGNDGSVAALTAPIDNSTGYLQLPREGRELWIVPSAIRTGSRTALAWNVAGLLSQDIYWGYEDAVPPASPVPRLKAPGNPAVPGAGIRRLALSPSGALVDFPPTGGPLFSIGSWKASKSLYEATGLSASGIAIGATGYGTQSPAVWHDGRWRELKQAAPGLSSPWNGDDVSLLHTTGRGWTVARRGSGDAATHAAVLPIRLEGHIQDGSQLVTEAVGVDAWSAGSTHQGPGIQDRLWAMVPIGREVSVKFNVPVDSNSPLEISAPSLTINQGSRATVTTNGQVVSFKANADTASGTEILPELKLGTSGNQVTSLSKPIGFKAMKSRRLKLNVFKVTKAYDPSLPALPSNDTPIPNAPNFVPTALELDVYLNKIFYPQLNVTFDTNLVQTPLVVDWDVGSRNGSLDVVSSDDYSVEQDAILASVPTNTPVANIDIFLLGTSQYLVAPSTFQGPLGVTNRPRRSCWMAADPVGGNTQELMMHSIAHEIGHVLRGYGHPDQSNGPAILHGVEYTERNRLMFSVSNPDIGSVLVKEEWDEAEEWLKIEERDGRIH